MTFTPPKALRSGVAALLLLAGTVAQAAQRQAPPNCPKFVFSRSDVLDAAPAGFVQAANERTSAEHHRLARMLKNCKISDDGLEALVTCKIYTQEEALDKKSNADIVWTGDKPMGQDSFPSQPPATTSGGVPATVYYSASIIFELKATCVAIPGNPLNQPYWGLKYSDFQTAVSNSEFVLDGSDFRLDTGKKTQYYRQRAYHHVAGAIPVRTYEREGQRVINVNTTGVGAWVPAGFVEMTAVSKMNGEFFTSSVDQTSFLALGNQPQFETKSNIAKIMLLVPVAKVKLDRRRIFLTWYGVEAVIGVMFDKPDYAHLTKKYRKLLEDHYVLKEKIVEKLPQLPRAYFIETDASWDIYYDVKLPGGITQCRQQKGANPLMLHERSNGLLLDPEFFITPGSPEFNTYAWCP